VVDATSCADFTGDYLSPSDFAVITVKQSPPDYDCSSMVFNFPNGLKGYGRAQGNNLYLGKGRFVGNYVGDQHAAFVTFNHKDNLGHDYIWIKLQNTCEQVAGVWRGKINLAGVFRLGAGSILNGEFLLEQHGCKVILRAPAGHPDWPKEQVIAAVVASQFFSVFHDNGVIEVPNFPEPMHIKWPNGDVWTRREKLAEQTHLSAPVMVGESTMKVQKVSGWEVGDFLKIGKEVKKVNSVFPLVLSSPLELSYPAGTDVQKIEKDNQKEIEAAIKADPCSPSNYQEKYLESSEGKTQPASRGSVEEEPVSGRLSRPLLAVSFVTLVSVGVACFVRTAKKMRRGPVERQSSQEASSAELQEARPSLEDSALLTEADTTA